MLRHLRYPHLLVTSQAKSFSLRLFFHFSEFHFLRLLTQWTSTRSWGNELCNPIMYDVKKYFLLFVIKLLPKDFFQCPLVLVFPEGMRCCSQISIFGGFQDLSCPLCQHFLRLKNPRLFSVSMSRNS